MLFHPPVHVPLLGRRLGGLAVSAALHAALVLSATFVQADTPSGLAEPVAGLVVVPVAPERVTPQAPRADPPGEIAADRPTLEVAGVSVDLTKILTRRDRLFPFLTLETPLVGAPDESTSDKRTRIRSPVPSGTRTSRQPPLELSDQALQALVDRAWSRRERWRPFAPIAALLASHDPDDGRAAELVQAYSDQNLLQPYYDADTRDARYWAMLGLAADHATFIELVRRFAREHPSSKVTIELLFLVDELAQGSRDTLLMLTSTNPQAALRQTAAQHREAYELALTLRAHYGSWLRARDLESEAAIRLRYDRVRLQLLSAIIDGSPGGYRVADARYLAGVVLFEQNNLDAAATLWNAITPDRRDTYFVAYSDVLQALRAPEAARAAEIVRVLGSEHRRWLDFSEQRLRKFGHGFDSF